MSDKLISVVTTFFNAEDTIEDTILSIANQSYKNIEVIFVDGKSTDKSLDIVRRNAFRFDRIKIISEPDNGIYDGMNKGIINAEGEIVAILNADDYFEPNALTDVNRLFEYGCDILAGTIQKILPNGEKEKLIYRSELPLLSPKSATIHHPSVFVKKALYNSIGIFNTNYQISADYDFIARAVNAGANIIYTDIVMTNMRVGGVSDCMKFHTKKNIEHLYIGYSNIYSIKEKIKHLYYVTKKYVYGILKHQGIIK
jgi:glycosyltransferase involved in cell wall biosynthesis